MLQLMRYKGYYISLTRLLSNQNDIMMEIKPKVNINLVQDILPSEMTVTSYVCLPKSKV